MTAPEHAPNAIRAMMAGAIDYAGLFPPAGLSMPEAVRNFDAYRSGPDAWMLGRFIVPVDRLDELIGFLPFETDPNRRISVIAKPADVDALVEFRTKHAPRVRIDTVETPVVAPQDVILLSGLSREFLVYAEVDITNDPLPVVSALAANGIRAKVRTGGVTPAAIPSPERLARFIVACVKSKVVFKATAGLHHALRGEYALTYTPDSPRAEMFGFVNLILATAFAVSGANAGDVGMLLRAGSELSFGANGATFGARPLTPVTIAMARKAVVASFGSCSFGEPVEELRSRGLL